MAAGFNRCESYCTVLNLNPNPSNLEGFGTPASFNGAWSKHRCRAEGFATRLIACVKITPYDHYRSARFFRALVASATKFT
jgi:hypothetical protein